MEGIQHFIEIQHLLQKLELLPSHRTREFETILTEMAKESRTEEVQQLREWLHRYIENEGFNRDQLFAGFVLLNIYYRRRKDRSKLKELVDIAGPQFQHYPLYSHLLSLLYKELEDHEKSIYLSREAMEKLSDHPGVVHNYAESIIKAKEENYPITDQELNEAYEALKPLLIYSNYPKFYCTQGRFLAALGKFSEAKAAIMEAIDKEDSESSDYAIRINDYQSILIRVQTLEFNSMVHEKLSISEQNTLQLKGQIETSFQEQKRAIDDSQRDHREDIDRSIIIHKQEMDKSLQEMKSENLQMLGFFVAIISFTIGSINLLKEKSFLESALLILILAGSLMLVYVGFGVLFNLNQQKFKRVIYFSLISIILIASSFIGYFYLK